jgi:hypothetical protein
MSLLKKRRTAVVINEETTYDIDGTPEQKVLGERWLLMEIAKWSAEAYRVISLLNRAGGILALDQSLYYRTWRVDMKRRFAGIDRYDNRYFTGWDFINAPGTVCDVREYRDSGLREIMIAGNVQRRMFLGNVARPDAVRYSYWPANGVLSIYKRAVLRSGKTITRRTTNKREIERFLALFEKYKDGPFPAIT